MIAAALSWALVVALSGLAIGWLIAQIGVFGNLMLVFLGVMAGVASRRITGRPVRWIGWMLVVALFVAYFFTLVGWLRFGSFVGGDTWVGAFGLLPKVNTTTMVPGLICAAFGAHAAYSRAGADLWKRFLKTE